MNMHIVRGGLVCLVALALATGCVTRDASRPVSSCVVADDQSITLEGKRVGIDEFVKMAKERSPDKQITFQVSRESKIRPETLAEIPLNDSSAKTNGRAAFA